MLPKSQFLGILHKLNNRNKIQISKCSLRTVIRQFCNVAEHKISDNEEEEMSPRRAHVPVMATEVLEAFEPSDNQVFVDMTFGAGGHSELLLKSAKNIKILALDRDSEAMEHAQKLAEKYKGQVRPMLGKFSQLDDMLRKAGVEKSSIDGVLFDVGASSMQMDSANRGFALSKDGPLDMRMSSSSSERSARDVVNSLDVISLAKILKIYGDERMARPIAEAIVEARLMLMPIQTTKELASLVQSVVERTGNTDSLGRRAHVATKTFQALRIFVNDELNELDCGIELAYEYLKPGGKLVTICFHSLEDRVVKNHLIGVDMDGTISPVNLQYKSVGYSHSKEEVKKLFDKRWTGVYNRVRTPTDDEIEENPRARSARLRAAFKN